MDYYYYLEVLYKKIKICENYSERKKDRKRKNGRKNLYNTKI